MKYSNESRQREHINVEIFGNADEASYSLASEIASLIRANTESGRHTVLGLATGSTPVRLYRELIRMHREEGLSFSKVISFNLDEYYGIPSGHAESYWRFMQEQLFAHIDILPENIHVPDGMVPRSEVYDWCRVYEEKILKAGGIDIQVLGIGRTGHIGFNEPGSSPDSRTRMVTLDSVTRHDAARDFLGEANVPRHAITMGIGTILDAKRVVLLAWGDAKARVLADAVENPPAETLPASFLQRHPNVSFRIDRAAASELTRIKNPWLVGPVEWTPDIIRRAITWLSKTVKKPVLKLLDDDYAEHGMSDLLTEQGQAYMLNIRVFNELQHTITGWPGGKPNAEDAHRPERASPHPKRVLVLSPEPSNEVTGMGGTIRRLVEQGHEVRVVCQSSGNLGVPDEEAATMAGFILEMNGGKQGPDSVSEKARLVKKQLEEKAPFDADSAELRHFKGILRRGEERAALRICGIKPEQICFMDLPFYERGRYRQFYIGDEDVSAMTELLRQFKPHQIFATGNSGDPSSVGSVSFEIFRRALKQTATEPWRKECRVWLYRSPDRNLSPAEIDMAVPMSPGELASKIRSIYQHESQRSQTPPVQGSRESWQQAENHDQAVARGYDELGLANYEAMEPFQRFIIE